MSITKKYDYFIPLCIFGDRSVGKTSLIYRFREDSFEDTCPTIGIEFSDREISVSNRIIKLQCWDTTGDIRFRSTVKMYFRNKAACIVAFDITDRSTFDSVPKWVEDLKAIAHENGCMVLVGTKADLESQRKVTREEAAAYAEKVGVKYTEISSKTGKGVKELFNTIASDILEKIDNGKIVVSDNTAGIRSGNDVSSQVLNKGKALGDQGEDQGGILGGLSSLICPKKKKAL